MLQGIHDLQKSDGNRGSEFIGKIQRKGREMKRPTHALMIIDGLMVLVICDMNYVFMSL